MTFIIKHRGSPSARTFADYYCEDHGRFELDVDRVNGEPPESMPCAHEMVEDYFPGDPPALCGKPSVWCISAPLAKVRAFEVVRGKSDPPARKTYTDTRNIGEGQPLHEWREDRAKVWEEKRKADVVRFAREHNERVRGD